MDPEKNYIGSTASNAPTSERFAMQTTTHRTDGYSPELTQQIRNTARGMAHWARTGPAGKICAQCQHWNYWRQIYNRSGAVVRAEQHKCCEKYERLTGRKGPQINKQLFACRHFQERTAGSQEKKI
jgi:hypothetical protein